MLKLSEVLINIVKNYDPKKEKKICLTASHFGTVGAVLSTKDKHGFKSEEDLFRVVVREAVDQLNKEDWVKVEQTGINEHEQSLSHSYYSAYDLVISNHFDAANGNKMTLYTNESLAVNLNNIRNMITARIGIAAAKLVRRDDLYMTTMSNAVLFEWFRSADEFDVNALLSHVGSTPTPPKQPVTPDKPADKPFPQNLIGMKVGAEEIKDAYFENNWYVFNTDNKNPVYPTLLDAMKNQNAFDFTLNKHDEIGYSVVIRSNTMDYLLYKSTKTGADRIVAIRNKGTNFVAGYVK